MRLGAVTHLTWVPPTVPSLLALARPDAADAWSAVREDPGAVLLLLRSPTARQLPPNLFSFASLTGCPEVLDLAVHHLRTEGEGRFPDWTIPGRSAVVAACRRYARQAQQLAEQTRRCDPELAWAGGLLAPLGWIALALASPAEVARGVYHGFDQTDLARRLCRRWMLPPWLAALAGHLGLPLDVAVQLGADVELFRITQLAVTLVQRQGDGLGLAVGANAAELSQTLGVSLSAPVDPLPPEETPATIPEAVRLADLLALTAENRRLRAAHGSGRIEDELDVLHRALEDQRRQEEERLRTQKLRALAEFAAGAGHEINNPLAVISGQAQYLLKRMADCSDPSTLDTLKSALQGALETIIGQTQRIHHLLRDVMQFARPAAPHLQPVELARLVDEVGVSLAGYAEERTVRLRVREPEPGRNGHNGHNGHHHQPLALLLRSDGPLMVRADAVQLRTALTCLLRNAIEAAPAGGWASIRLAPEHNGQVEVVIEDSGRGLPPAQREHLFDPFYSGRAAGRGPGLGLPTAWSLARQQGGDVSLASQPGEPTRFILRLPLHTEPGPALAC